MIIYESRKHRRNIHPLNTKERLSSGKDKSVRCLPKPEARQQSQLLGSDSAAGTRRSLFAHDGCRLLGDRGSYG